LYDFNNKPNPAVCWFILTMVIMIHCPPKQSWN